MSLKKKLSIACAVSLLLVGGLCFVLLHHASRPSLPPEEATSETRPQAALTLEASHGPTILEPEKEKALLEKAENNRVKRAMGTPQKQAEAKIGNEERTGARESLAASEGGPLDAHWEYLLCLFDKENPLNTAAVLCEKGHRTPSHFVEFQVRERLVRDDKRNLEFFVDSADPEKLVYWTAAGTPKMLYQMTRMRERAPLMIPARVLAQFVGDSRRQPVLYDVRTGFAGKEVAVPLDEDNLDSTRVSAVLAASGMPLEEGLLKGDQTVLYWKSSDSSRMREGAFDLAQAVPIIEKDGEIGLTSQGRSVSMSRGELGLMQVLRLFSDLEGVSVYSTVPSPVLKTRKIVTISRMTDVNSEILRALLDVNGILARETVTKDRKALIVSTQGQKE